MKKLLEIVQRGLEYLLTPQCPECKKRVDLEEIWKDNPYYTKEKADEYERLQKVPYEERVRLNCQPGFDEMVHQLFVESRQKLLYKVCPNCHHEELDTRYTYTPPPWSSEISPSIR